MAQIFALSRIFGHIVLQGILPIMAKDSSTFASHLGVIKKTQSKSLNCLIAPLTCAFLYLALCMVKSLYHNVVIFFQSLAMLHPHKVIRITSQDSKA